MRALPGPARPIPPWGRRTGGQNWSPGLTLEPSPQSRPRRGPQGDQRSDPTRLVPGGVGKGYFKKVEDRGGAGG